MINTDQPTLMMCSMVMQRGQAKRLRLKLTGAFAAVTLLSTVLSCAQAQTPDAAKDKTAQSIAAPPAVASAKIRSFTGNWVNDKVIVGLTKPGVAPLRPEYEARLEALAKLAVAGEEVPGNEPKCIPNGPPLDMAFGMRVFADATQMVVINSGPRVRYIWLDGRPHTADDYLFESYAGESIAHWEGDTLVVDTIGLKATDEIIFGIAVNDDKMHMVERWKLVAPTTLQIQTTIEDAAALTKPWTYTRSYSRRPPGSEVQYCTSTIDRTRDGGFDLSPPAGGYVPPGVKE